MPREAQPWKAVVGYFDPMHAGHARRLQQLCAPGEKIVVFVDDPPNPLLPARARAELLAGLACVGYVVIGADGASGCPVLLDERVADGERAREFTSHVLARHELRNDSQ